MEEDLLVLVLLESKSRDWWMETAIVDLLVLLLMVAPLISSELVGERKC